MKVLILSTYEKTGGAAIAANRLLHALQKNGVEATMLCRRNLSWWKGKPQSLTSILERGFIWAASGFSLSGLWAADLALFGQDVTKTREYREADVIHLHWVCQGFISLSAVRQFLSDGKKVVWTLHDAWNSIGMYHFRIQKKDSWLERWNAGRKAKLYASGKIKFVTCSEWLKNECLEGELMKGQDIVAIPNPIDVSIFKPSEHENKRRVLFVAQNVNDERKGIKYLDEAAKQLPDVEIVALGRDIPYISDIQQMAQLYASVDAFVLPSLSDNLPNTIMEAMACGTPCVGFNVGGIPEMIEHKVNGYVAEYRNSDDLARGINYVLDNANNKALGAAAVEKVNACYSEKAVAERYIKLYNE